MISYIRHAKKRLPQAHWTKIVLYIKYTGQYTKKPAKSLLRRLMRISYLLRKEWFGLVLYELSVRIALGFTFSCYIYVAQRIEPKLLPVINGLLHH